MTEYTEKCSDTTGTEFALYGADPDCDGEVVSAGPGGGAKCTKCSGWFCF